jgi:hypothetical protein
MSEVISKAMWHINNVKCQQQKLDKMAVDITVSNYRFDKQVDYLMKAEELKQDAFFDVRFDSAEGRAYRAAKKEK